MTRFVISTPVLNGAEFIHATLDSVKAQSDSDWAHYLVDGGSTDGTLDILAEAADQDPRRHIVTGKDRGLFDAWFKGFEHASADGVIDPRTVCVWLGSDDLLMPWAFSTLRRHFDETGADWIAALPSIWNGDGQLGMVQPFNWYPRRLIRAGQFHNRSLGGMQMESIFFTHRLLSKLPAQTLEDIRVNKLAGDFVLWREFARYADLVPITTAVAGFRLHGTNLSSVQEDGYFREIARSGVWFPPRWLAPVLRVGFRQLSLLKTGVVFRNEWKHLKTGLAGLPST